MRALSADLLWAQGEADPAVEVVVRCKRRSTFAGDPLLWRPLFVHGADNLPYSDAYTTAAVCGCAEYGAAVRVLRSPAGRKVGVQRLVNMHGWGGTGNAWSAAAAAAMTASPTQIATLTSGARDESTPGVGRNGNEIRVLFGDGSAFYQVKSTDDGASWGAKTLVLSNSVVYTRFSNFSLCAAGGVWYAVYTGFDLRRRPRVLGMHDAGAGWVQWPALSLNAGQWQVAGVRVGPEAAPNGRVYAYVWGKEGGYSTLACQQVVLTAGGLFSAWGSLAVVDRAGVSGAASYERVRFGEGGGAYLFALQERAVKRYWFTAALYALPGNADMEEPVFLGDGDIPAGGLMAQEMLTPISCGRRAWLVGAGQVWASAQTDAAVDLAVRSYVPISYSYEVAWRGGGALRLRLPRSSSAPGGVEDFSGVYPPEVYVGDMLWVDRTLSATTAAGILKSGTQTLVFRVAAVWYGRDGIDVVAQDALGVLAGMRPRRGKLLPAGDRLRMAEVEAMCHWAGLKVRGADVLPDAAANGKGFVWAANESGLGGLFRYLMDQSVVIRSDAPVGAEDHVFVRVVWLPSTQSYVYVSPNGRREGFGRHEVANWALGHDGRQVRLFVGLGLAVRNAPGSGEGWVLGAARRVGNERPYPLVAVDRSYASDDGTLAKRVAAEAARLGSGLSLGWIEATANLGVELYDVVRIDETDARVVRIVESWEQGRLVQRLDLAEVNSYGVWSG